MENLEDMVLNHDLTEGEVKDNSPLAKSVLGTLEAQVKAISAVEHIANKIFQLYFNFLSEEARQPWINSSPWKVLRE